MIDPPKNSTNRTDWDLPEEVPVAIFFIPKQGDSTHVSQRRDDPH